MFSLVLLARSARSWTLRQHLRTRFRGRRSRPAAPLRSLAACCRLGQSESWNIRGAL